MKKTFQNGAMGKGKEGNVILTILNGRLKCFRKFGFLEQLTFVMPYLSEWFNQQQIVIEYFDNSNRGARG